FACRRDGGRHSSLKYRRHLSIRQHLPAHRRYHSSQHRQKFACPGIDRDNSCCRTQHPLRGQDAHTFAVRHQLQYGRKTTLSAMPVRRCRQPLDQASRMHQSLLWRKLSPDNFRSERRPDKFLHLLAVKQGSGKAIGLQHLDGPLHLRELLFAQSKAKAARLAIIAINFLFRKYPAQQLPVVERQRHYRPRRLMTQPRHCSWIGFGWSAYHKAAIASRRAISQPGPFEEHSSYASLRQPVTDRGPHQPTTDHSHIYARRQISG